MICMRNFLKLFTLCALVAGSGHMIHPAYAADTASQKVILKLDDMSHRGGKVPDSWERTYEYLSEQNVAFSVGIIGQSLGGETPLYFERLKAWAAGGLVEFWNHGYDHKQWESNGQRIREFQGTSYAHQFAHIMQTQDLAQANLGLTLVSFGAGFNSIDENTVQALQDCPDLKVWLFGSTQNPGGKHVLKRNYKINLEHKTGQLDFEQFMQAYHSQERGELLVLQGHPMLWDAGEFATFQQMIAFLKDEGAIFILPRDTI